MRGAPPAALYLHDERHPSALDRAADDLGPGGRRPERAGRGVGTAQLRHGLERAAADGVGAFLETGVERNARCYERFGFRTVLEADAPGGGPHVWVMRCDP